MSKLLIRKDNFEPEDSKMFDWLSEKLKDQYLEVRKELREVPNSKGNLTVGIEIASLALNMGTVIVAILSYWKSQFPKYSVSVKIGDFQSEIENIDKATFEEYLKEAKEKSKDIELNISE